MVKVRIYEIKLNFRQTKFVAARNLQIMAINSTFKTTGSKFTDAHRFIQATKYYSNMCLAFCQHLLALIDILSNLRFVYKAEYFCTNRI